MFLPTDEMQLLGVFFQARKSCKAPSSSGSHFCHGRCAQIVHKRDLSSPQFRRKLSQSGLNGRHFIDQDLRSDNFWRTYGTIGGWSTLFTTITRTGERYGLFCLSRDELIAQGIPSLHSRINTFCGLHKLGSLHCDERQNQLLQCKICSCISIIPFIE